MNLFQESNIIQKYSIITNYKQQKMMLDCKQEEQQEKRQKKSLLIKQLTKQIQKAPYSIEHYNDYVLRSEQFQIIGDNQSAIIDLSKSLTLQPTCKGYIKRGKLYVNNEMFYSAFQDFEQAKKIYKQKDSKIKIQQTQETRIELNQTIKIDKQLDEQMQYFLQNSIVMSRLPQMKKIAIDYQNSKQYMTQEQTYQFKQIIQKMIDNKQIKQKNKEIKYQQSKQKMIQRLQKLILQCQNVIKKQQQQIQILKGNAIVDYVQVFNRQMDKSTMNQQNRYKCIIYYNTLIFQMERYYSSAKLLSQFDEKISFEAYNDKKSIPNEARETVGQNYIKKVGSIFRLFDKKQSKLQRVGQIMNEIPYIGQMMRIIKITLGWLQRIKQESQSQNIISIRPTISLFNQLSAQVAYQMYKYFKLNIVTGDKLQKYKKSKCQQILKIYQKIRRNLVGYKVYQIHKIQQITYAQQMGKIHALIVMTGIAQGLFKMPSRFQLENGDWQHQFCKKIQQIQTLLLQPIQYDESQKYNSKIHDKQIQKDSSKCVIF